MSQKNPWPCPKCGAQLALRVDGIGWIVLGEIVGSVLFVLALLKQPSVWILVSLGVVLFVLFVFLVVAWRREEQQPTILDCPKCGHTVKVYLGTRTALLQEPNEKMP
jgi:predicted RNA-binding Zn-ribbon protein involved in translation (DUF1610 family)